jgi:hypothetical protein
MFAVLISVVLAGQIDDRPLAAACEACGVRYSSIENTIHRLRTARKTDDREDAARALGRVRWQCHPEVVIALCNSLLGDPKDDVREEAAEALERLRAPLAEAHAALRRAAMTDSDSGVRKKSRRALQALPRETIVTTREYVVPGSVRVLKSVPPEQLNPVEPSLRESVRPVPSEIIPPEDVPPPPPTPATVPPARSSRTTPPGDGAIRRSSAKPVVSPPALEGIAPLEGPKR